MAGPDKSREPAINRENKASAMRWGVGAAILLLVAAAVWVMSDHRGEMGDLTPQDLPGQETDNGGQANQPPAVAPDADSNSGTLNAPPPATSGAGTQ